MEIADMNTLFSSSWHSFLHLPTAVTARFEVARVHPAMPYSVSVPGILAWALMANELPQLSLRTTRRHLAKSYFSMTITMTIEFGEAPGKTPKHPL